jgi:microsomal dipeptidase-like Zn-dependent dipeptidase
MKINHMRQNKTALFDVHGGDTQVRFPKLVKEIRIVGPNYTQLYSQRGWDRHRLPLTGHAPIMTATEANAGRTRIYEQMQKVAHDGGKTTRVWGIEALDAFLDLEHIIELIRWHRETGIGLKVQLTYNHQNHLATGCRVGKEENGVWTYDQDTGLSGLGRMVARLLAQNGIVVDVSHLNTKSALDVAEAVYSSGRPVIASHAVSRTVFSENELPQGEQHPCFVRALDDAVIEAVLLSGGFVGITPHPYLLFGQSAGTVMAQGGPGSAADGANPTLEAMTRHIKHVRRVAQRCGTSVQESVALASDSELDAKGGLVRPAGYSEQNYPRLFLELAGMLEERGWSEGEMAALMHGNAQRVFRLEKTG